MSGFVAVWSTCLRHLCDLSKPSDRNQVPSLRVLTTRFVGTRQSIVEAALSRLPDRLVASLLRPALETMNYPCIKTLVSNWPLEILRLGDLGWSEVPKFSINSVSFTMNSVRVATAIIKAFFDALDENPPEKLETLDLSGFPLAGPGLQYLFIQTILIHKKSNRERILDTLRRAQERGQLHWTSTRSFGDLGQGDLPHKSYSIVIDCLLQRDEEDLLANLCSALKVSRLSEASSEGAVRLRLRNLQAEFISGEEFSSICDLIRPEDLEGLSLKLMAIEEGDWDEALSRVAQMSNLTALELQNYTQFRVASPDSFHTQETLLCSVVNSLPLLRRLSLLSRAHRTTPERILQHVCQPLEFLDLSSWSGLSLLDVSSLRNCHDCLSHLTSLDLSGDKDSLSHHSDIGQLCALLSLSSRSLEILRLCDCLLLPEQLKELAQFILEELFQLRIFCMQGNYSPEPIWKRTLATLAAHPRLESVETDGFKQLADPEGRLVDNSTDDYQAQVLELMAKNKGERQFPVRLIIDTWIIETGLYI